RLAVEALEGPGQAVRVAGVEARPVVPHHVGRALDVDARELDARARLLRRVLPGVAEQVLERDPQQAAVPAGLEPRGHDDLDLARGVARPQVVDDRLREL